MRRLLLTFATLSLLVSCAFAQNPADKRVVVGDNRGREFWLAFPKNAIFEQGQEIELTLFITADKAANVTVTIPGLRRKYDFHLNPSDIKQQSVDSICQLLESEKIQDLGVHVEADNDIAVYGVSHRKASTDSYLALPVSVLGTSYRAIGYHSLPNQGSSQQFATEFAIIGTQDHTLINLSLTSDTKGGHRAGDTYTIELNRGQTYMVTSDVKPNKRGDLTGTLVTANKPIAFFVAHSCAQVPPEVQFCDMLLEQEPPVPSWGRQFYIGKFASKSQYVIRAMASEDNTQVFLDNKLVAKLKAGDFYENNHLSENSFLTSSAPVLVAQYAQSSEADSIKVGDPFMLLVPPTEQFVNSYRFATPIRGQWHHYINLVVPLDAEASLKLDNRSVPIRYFKPIGISRYGIAQLEIDFGTHTVSCDKAFGLYSYGFGVLGENFDSYGNCGGQLVETVPILADTARPELELVSDDAQRSLPLIARDDRLFDAGLGKITVIDSVNFRSPLEIPKFDPGAPEVPLTFQVQDTSQCGFMSIRLEDVAHNVSYWIICRTNDGHRWFYSLREGRENICPTCRAWTAQFISTPAFTVSDVNFKRPSYLKGPEVFDQFSTRLSGGFQGVYIYPIDKSLQYALGIGYSNFTGAAVGTHTSFVNDSILYGDTAGARKSKVIEQFSTEAALSYLTVNGGLYYYLIPEKLYLYTGLAAGFLISGSYVETSRIAYPATLVDSTGRSTGSRELTQATGSLPDATPFHIALEVSPGLQFKLSQNVALLAGAYMNLPLFNAVRDLEWHLTTFGARIGLQYRH